MCYDWRMNALASHCRDIAARARQAAIDLAAVSSATKAACLRAAAARIRADIDAILAANALDLSAAPGFGLSAAAIVLAGAAWLASVQMGHPLQAARFSLVGASGAVMAVLAVFIWYFPRQTLLLWGVLPVPAWALGLLYFVSDVQGATSGGGNVAHVAHIAGAIFGLLYAWRGWHLGGLADVGAAFRRRRMRVVRPDDDSRSAPRPSARPREPERLDPDLQEQVDRILEKISRSGESSLTTSERDTLTQASRRLKERSRS